MTDDHQTPWQADRNRTERTGKWPESWGPFHRHFANDAVHRDGGSECDQPGTPRRVYVFDPDTLHEHELIVARYAIAHPESFNANEEYDDNRDGKEGDNSAKDSLKSCHFWDIWARECHFEMLVLGCRQCADCPGSADWV